ncbi:hypothetical protein [Acetobacter sp.]|uniref:pirin family protein n=1 Tax=Acetobacter sp. TaxID=440 RepID=UPI0039EA8E23
MITIIRAASLGTAHSGGLSLRCHFAFADYQDPTRLHEGRLRAVNLGTLTAGAAYCIGPETAVDIVTLLQAGTMVTEIAGFHKQNLSAGEVHLISAGTGCEVLSWTAGSKGASFIQFWFLPDMEGTAPIQDVRPSFSNLEDGGFRIIASGFPEDDPEDEEVFPDGAPMVLTASARLLHAAIPAGEGAAYRTVRGRNLYLVVVSGNVRVGEDVLHAGDAASLCDSIDLTVMADEAAIVLVADVAS